jgi:hypothetical protein
MTVLEAIAKGMATLTPILVVLVGTGVIYKYVPFLAKLPNVLIPFLNAVIAFIGVFAGGPAPAQASVVGDALHGLGMVAKIGGSLAIAGIASGFYEVFLRGPLERFGIYRAGMTKAEKAAKAKIVQIG